MRIVLDTNVIISGLLWKGNAKVLFDLIEKGNTQICLTPKILDEIKKEVNAGNGLGDYSKYEVEEKEVWDIDRYN